MSALRVQCAWCMVGWWGVGGGGGPGRAATNNNRDLQGHWFQEVMRDN